MKNPNGTTMHEPIEGADQMTDEELAALLDPLTPEEEEATVTITPAGRREAQNILAPNN